MTDNISDIEVNDRKSFIDFIKLLHKDYLENPETWENRSLDNFLSALSRFTEDIQGYYDNTGQKVNADIASWKLFSDILSGSKVYE